jgi:hypothetical protein
MTVERLVIKFKNGSILYVGTSLCEIDKLRGRKFPPVEWIDLWEEVLDPASKDWKP